MKTTFSKIEAAGWNVHFTRAEKSVSRNLSARAKAKLKSGRSFGQMLTATLSVNFAGTILALLLEAVSHPSAPPSRIAEHFSHSFVYSNCIGTLIGFFVFGLAPRLTLLRFPLDWALLVCMIFLASLVGSFAAGFTLMATGIFPAGDYGWI